MFSTAFLTAGKATFTVDNGKGEHYTYSIREKLFPSTKFAGEEIRYLFIRLKGTGQGNKFSYLGSFEQGRCCLTKKSPRNNLKAVKVFDWAVAQVANRAVLPEGYSIKHSGKCGKCGRKLTDPQSIDVGLGPVCRR